VLAGEGEHRVGEHPVDDGQRLGQALGSLAQRPEGDAGLLVLEGVRAAADPDVEATVRDHVGGGDHLGQQRRVAEVVVEDEVAHPQRRGPGEQRRRQRPSLQGRAVGDHGRVEVVVDPERTQPEALGSFRLLEDLVEGERHLGQVDPERGPRAGARF
jgi:hypothetical protein